ncbi:hypothetical protein DOTSEDRAFT_39679 [Dothistroma septosporum NZE10]|uniref:Uncharacterized protein n=1 Tax=Dothistroma septosporum (strain NZE10 / CBS 128990) TaxID=675120 RepID=M2XZP3_DOTSN|nr:hypothetical protein DOTSEDRAFT_39679 [Dothistroma septosporum NZE10]
MPANSFSFNISVDLSSRSNTLCRSQTGSEHLAHILSLDTWFHNMVYCTVMGFQNTRKGLALGPVIASLDPKQGIGDKQTQQSHICFPPDLDARGQDKANSKLECGTKMRRKVPRSDTEKDYDELPAETVNL